MKPYGVNKRGSKFDKSSKEFEELNRISKKAVVKNTKKTGRQLIKKLLKTELDEIE